jgi:acetyltransferase-like isoleucine patch superfamily enzyme
MARGPDPYISELAVVTRRVEPGTVVLGLPARPVRRVEGGRQ